MSNPLKKRLADLDDSLFIPRELSWLSFNSRVLQEAADPRTPVIQRLRYLGIFSNNMDEFFRVRVAEVRRLISVSSGAQRQRAKDLLVDIQSEVVALQRDFERIYDDVLRALRQRKIYMVNERQLDEGQAAFVQSYFTNKVLPELEPILLRDGQAIPVLTDESLYLAVDILSGDDYFYALVELPTDHLDRFVEIPKRKGKGGRVFMALDNVIRACLPQVFRGVVPIDEASAYCFKFSRDAELELDASITESLIEKMATSLKQRRKADAVRFVYDEKMPERLLSYLRTRFGFGKYDSLIPGGRYHNSKDFIGFPNVGPKYLEFKPLPPIRIERLEQGRSLFDTIRERDVFLYYPYHPFDYIVDLLKTAALDPQVLTIRICLYRVASDSRIVDALLNATANGKRVMAVVELAARFDEAANISWAQRLTEAGIEVIFGIPGLKVHSKLLLIERREEKGIRYYSHVGTGNFNEKTARLYTDFTLLTRDQNIGKDVASIFEFLKYPYRRPNYKLLLVSPHSSRSGLMELIDQEIANARDGYHAEMVLKCNNLVDRQLTMKLYEASDAGVDVKLIVRGMCSLKPGVKGISDNIRAVSIVDRYLEHPRAYVFHNKGNPRYFIGSADLMTRNLDYRVEALCPIFDEDAQDVMQAILDQQWHDNVKARVLNAEQDNVRVSVRKKVARIRSQETIHRYLKTGKLPRYPKTTMRDGPKRRRKKNL
ncbi:polyphosphate kinase 1 [Parahalioglobus pacificus]|uniref:Polyphosphate kinase n=1 Tax=Parahalioglobus pacificus TaxID=930806 RepID=A0A919CIG5_9GAMM|nr:polyphosphate kinase 1 [Halioglobus pacificus]GHD28744.1 polyphosphate kinase [Halioglobus pacificus]